MTAHTSQSSLTSRRRAALNEVLHQLASRAHAAQLFVTFERLRELSERLLSRRELVRSRGRRHALRPVGDEAETRLGLAHRREQARLLREALELALWSTPEGRWWGCCELSGPSHERWSEDAALELDRALLEGATVDGDLLACCLLERAHWPEAASLARAAAHLEPGWRAELAGVRVALLAAPGDDALAWLARLLKRELPLAERAQLQELAAVTHERRGEPRTALRAYERSLSARPAPRAALAGWTLAEELDESVARELAWRAVLETWRGGAPLGPAREDHLWRELRERRALAGLPLARTTRRACEAMLQAGVSGAGA